MKKDIYMKVICLKRNGKVKLVDNQFDLNVLSRKDYTAYLFPTGIYTSCYKPINPKSGWTKPVKKITITYTLASFMSGSFIIDDNDDDTDESIQEGKTNRMEFDSILQLVAFIHSLEKMAASNVLKMDAFERTLFIENFYMLITDINGNIREFKMTKKMAKKQNDFFSSMGFTVPTLIKALEEFMDDNDKKFKFSNPFLTGKFGMRIFISNDFKKWSTGGIKDAKQSDWLASVSLVLSGGCTFVRSDVMHYMSIMHYGGLVTLASYIPIEDEDNLPFECPVTADLVDEYSGKFFDMYDHMTYHLLTASDFIEAAAMGPYYLRTIKKFDELKQKEFPYIEEMKYLYQVSLFPTSLTPGFREVDPPPLKFMLSENELDILDLDQSISDFIKALFLWVDDPKSLDGIDDYADVPF